MNKQLIIIFLEDNFYRIFFIIAMVITSIWFFRLFDNTDALNKRIVAYEYQNNKLKDNNILLIATRDSLNKSINTKDSIMANMVERDKNLQILVNNIDNKINLLNKKYDQASKRVINFNSDSIVRYFSKNF